jgi:hypothetical protein
MMGKVVAQRPPVCRPEGACSNLGLFYAKYICRMSFVS